MAKPFELQVVEALKAAHAYWLIGDRALTALDRAMRDRPDVLRCALSYLGHRFVETANFAPRHEVEASFKSALTKARDAARNVRSRLLPHTERLLQAGTDTAAFDAALNALNADRSIRKVVWVAIANEYRNAPTGGTYIHKFRTVSEAQRAIRSVFIERFEAESKRAVIDRLFA